MRDVDQAPLALPIAIRAATAALMYVVAIRLLVSEPTIVGTPAPAWSAGSSARLAGRPSGLASAGQHQPSRTPMPGAIRSARLKAAAIA